MHSSEVKNLCADRISSIISIYGWDITTSGLAKTNARHIGIFLPIATSNITVIGVLFRIMLPDFVQIGPPAAEWWRSVQFQDGGCGGLILLPVSYKMMSLSSEGQSLSANQMSSTYLNPRLRYTYFRYGKTNARHTEILLFAILTRSQQFATA